MHFAEIILPVPLSGSLTYLVAEGQRALLRQGMPVKVQLGTKSMSGIVAAVHEGQPEPGVEYKQIEEILYPEPVVGKRELELWNWVAEYYLCPIGAVMSAAMPTELLNGLYSDKQENFLVLSKDADNYQGKLTEKQATCLNAIKEGGSYMRKAELAEFSKQIASLINKGLLQQTVQTVRRASSFEAVEGLKALSPAQNKALEEIKQGFAENKTVLLHGVPASGKTEIYKQLIFDCLQQGGQVLYLLPEILLTSQLEMRLGRVFGDKLAVVHSAVPPKWKAEAFKEANAGRAMVVLGARSAVFTPFSNLKLVVIDEEHDASFKQDERAPLYNARAAAIVMAKLSGANVLLGSATPSAESMFNCAGGKFKKVTLKETYFPTLAPEVQIIDMVEERKKRKVRNGFSFTLMDAMQRTVAAGKQVILFHGRRGFNTYVGCDSCDWTPKCPVCGVSMVYHEKIGKLKCHYCGRVQFLPKNCPQCGGTVVRGGCGTEKLEQDLAELYPSWRIIRIDSDICRSLSAARALLRDFESGDANVLIGTQMLVKGLDFANVGLVAIPNADLLLNYPDFRSLERALQTFLQVGGRAGRKEGRGLLMLQTRKQDHPLWSVLAKGCGRQYYHMVLEERRLFAYPPYSRLVMIELRHKDQSQLRDMAADAAAALAPVFGRSLSGPFTPYPSVKFPYHLSCLMLKAENSLPYKNVNAVLSKMASDLYAKYGRNGAVVFNVDPA